MMARQSQAAAKPTGQMRLSEPFRITVLLDDDLQFNAPDIQAAVAEDFPTLDWAGADAWPDLPFDTAGVAAVPVTCGAGIGPGVIMGGGAPPMEWTPLFRRNRIDPDGEAAMRMTQSAAHLEISVNCAGTDLVSRINAARYATALAAVFADLPIASGIAIGWCDRTMAASDFLRAAEAVRAGRIPMLHWLNLVPFRDPAEPNLKSGVSVGLAPFFGVEVEIRQSPETQAEALRAIYAAASHLFDGKACFVDGAEFIGPASKGAAPVTYRLRHLPEGKLGNDTDRWLLLHPESPFRDRKLLGRAKPARTPHEDWAMPEGEGKGWLAKRVAGIRRGTATAG